MKRYKAEQIVTLLRQIEVGIANGKPTPQGCNGAEITIQTYYRWRKEYGGSEAESSQTDEGAGAREHEAEAFGGGAISGEADREGCGLGKLLSPERRRCAVEHAHGRYEVSERHACRLLGEWRRT
jgi:putative transposase